MTDVAQARKCDCGQPSIQDRKARQCRECNRAYYRDYYRRTRGKGLLARRCPCGRWIRGGKAELCYRCRRLQERKDRPGHGGHTEQTLDERVDPDRPARVERYADRAAQELPLFGGKACDP